MLDAIKSLLGGSTGSHVPLQVNPQTDLNSQQRKNHPQEGVNNPAVEINLSPQARRIMEALEKGELKLDDKGKILRDDSPQQLVIPTNEAENDEPFERFSPLNDLVEDIVDKIGTGMLSADEISEIDQLFGEIAGILQTVGGAETVSNETEKLSGYDQLKATILYSELNRLLGNVGVFFGRDLAMAKMSASAQDDANQIFDELSSTLGNVQVEKMRSPQEARVDAIFRELEQLYAAARNNLPETQSRQITDFFVKFSQMDGANLG